MKIIEEGVLPEEIRYRHRCTRCRTLFEFMEADAVAVFVQKDGKTFVVDCPKCGSRRLDSPNCR